MSTSNPKSTGTKSSSRSPDKSKHERRSSSGKVITDRNAPVSSSKSSRSHSSKHSKSGSSSKPGSSPNKTKLLVDPAPNLTPDEKIQRVLAGEIHIVSYPGTSQYSQGAPSACGLAALNTIRIALDKPLQGVTGVNLLKSLSLFDTHLDATAICVHWSSRGHLEPDHLFSLPLFHQAMKVYDRHDKLVGFESFLTMINSLQTAETTNDITAALITRPPEIVAILRVPLSTTEPSVSSNLNRDESIYAIFDSHSRPEHPDGAGLTLLPSIAAAAQHLTALLRVNINTGSPGLSWEAQLMSQFSAHLVRRVEWRQPAEERTTRLAAIYEANVGLLHAFDAEEEAKRLRSEVTELREKARKLERELHHAYSALDSKPKSPIEPKPVSESKKYPEGLSEDALLALKMQEEFDAEDQLLTELAAEEPEQSKNVFDCGICFETFHMGALAPMDGCDHKYCRECMRDYIKSKLASRTFPLLCPTCHASKDGSRGTAGQALVEIIGLDEREYATYVELSLASLSVMVHCRKCQRAAFVMRADLESEMEITCPLPDCDYKWCKNCNKPIEGDEKHSCDGTSELRELMASEGWKECPGCKTPISRNEGCYHMTCTTPGCNSHFCYRCGALITQSLDRAIIQSAVNEHFRGRCDMFDAPMLSFLQRLRRR
ncbi:Ring finger [Rhizoctonia solani]|uniref:Ring finger n=1 Tax=Rhizoctonia solani TaxID=456999 RepID=A0A8H7H4Y5_9AGAM|nr:Ring finger [Rhizoctonia solani]